MPEQTPIRERAENKIPYLENVLDSLFGNESKLDLEFKIKELKRLSSLDREEMEVSLSRGEMINLSDEEYKAVQAKIEKLLQTIEK